MSVWLQALEKQNEQIEELESAAQDMQQQLADANKSVEQHASSMKRVCHLPDTDAATLMHQIELYFVFCC